MVSPENDPVAALLALANGYQKWANEGRLSRSVLPSSAVVHQAADPSLSAPAQALSQVATVNQTGPRQGQAYQTFKVLGRTYHVYYDAAGKRSVFKV